MPLMTLNQLRALDLIGRDAEPYEAYQPYVDALLDRQLIAPISDNPPRYAVTGKGLAFLAAEGYGGYKPNHVKCRVRRDGSLQGLRGNPHADKRAQ